MNDPNDLAAFLAAAWQHLMRGAADSRSPARYPALGTVSPDGVPEVRTVALRRASPSEGCVEVHTDLATAKVTALRARPIAALHVWLPKADLQIRLTCDMFIHIGADVQAAWDKVPEAARVSYGTQPMPGAPIPHVHAYDKPPQQDRFAVLEGRVTHIDLVELRAQHRRAGYTRADGFAGQWLAP